ncbi:hypothetical protein [Methanomethylovorans sp.]|uniref:hypothetical protein n=1 Tax=Methanomethylovorans sp. TaxID=2758717 RepID=UPI002B5B6722|nr:hypothetical protein [Methanomethylovorans sp.]
MEEHIKHPISELEVDEKDKDRIRKIMEDFEKLSPSEKLDVLQLQNIMLETVARHNEKYGIPRRTIQVERPLSEIVAHMSKVSIDYSQKCVDYYVEHVAKKGKLRQD